ncbi:MAG: M12 family metallo-peptidase [Chloroflexota bacterium]
MKFGISRFPSHFDLLALLILLVGLAWGSGHLAAANPEPLFQRIDSTIVEEFSNVALLSENLILVKANPHGVTRRPDAPLTIPLPDGRDLAARYQRIDQNSSGYQVWVGEIEGSPYSEVSLSISPAGGLTGVVRTENGTYRITQVANEIHQIELLTTPFPPGLEPIEVDIPDLKIEPLPHASSLTAQNQTEIDVAVLYTPIVQNKTADIDGLIALAVSTSNTSFQNSGVNLSLNLVGSALFTYDESAVSFENILTDIQANSSVNEYRNQVNADIVITLVEEELYCGVAYLMSSPSFQFEAFAYAIVADQCAVDDLSFPHEIGHLFGAQHDRANAFMQPAYPYAYGYVDPESEFRTVMAYSTTCLGPCPRVGYWSNPSVFYENKGVTGIPVSSSAAAANYLTLNNTAGIVASYRQSEPEAPTATPSHTPTNTPTPTITPSPTATPTPTPTPTPFPTVETTLSPEESFRIEVDNLTLDFPVRSVSSTAYVRFEALGRLDELPGTAPSGDRRTDHLFVLVGEILASGEPLKSFNNPFGIDLKYSEKDIRDVYENGLGIYFWNEDTSAWQKVDEATQDEVNNRLQSEGSRLTYWALMGEPKELIYLPWIDQ